MDSKTGRRELEWAQTGGYGRSVDRAYTSACGRYKIIQVFRSQRHSLYDAATPEGRYVSTGTLTACKEAAARLAFEAALS